ncbi:MAG: 3'(2'),5'-bisphosphate nucleotidase CysQ [Vampirovibrionales bacterium]|nr:3'(2'),5'-bisphosphate nucleotidase CysQ [Vampirovibrionales bacterium]
MTTTLLGAPEARALVSLARQAQEAILAVYERPLDPGVDVAMKADNSPLTAADRASHQVLASGLTRLFPGIPLISEEADLPSYDARRAWDCFWLIDPLDGTKNFLRRNGEFVVNIALIQGQLPVFGLICAPTEDTTHYGFVGGGCYRQQGDAQPLALTPRAFPESGPVRVLGSGDDVRRGPALDVWKAQGRIIERLKIGSALKFCRLVDGAADAYVRSGPTMEWDIAAGHAMALACGKTLLSAPDGGPFLYNKPSLLNPGFTCY